MQLFFIPKKIVTRLVLLTCLLVFSLASAKPLRAERAISSRLLPKDTLAYARVANVPEFVKRFQETAFAKMFSDPQIKPLVDTLYSKAMEALKEVKEEAGLSVEEMLKIPQGEISLALITGQPRKPPALVMIIDTGASAENAKKLVAKWEELMSNETMSNEIKRSEETVEGQGVVIYKSLRTSSDLVQFSRENTFVFCTSLETATEIIKNWNDGNKDNLEDNPKFSAIMRSCRAKDEDPQLTFFVDPIAMVRSFAVLGQGVQVQLALSAMSVLGLDGLQGVGGSLAYNVGEFDQLIHLHVLMDSPRAGVLDALQLKEGDITPQDWVPGNVSSYMTAYWDVLETYKKVEKIADGFRGEGKTAADLKQASDRIGYDIVTDFMPLLKGRFTLIIKTPEAKQEAREESEDFPEQKLAGSFMSSAQNLLFAIELTDEDKAKKIMTDLIERFGKEGFEKKSWAGQSYYAAIMPNDRNGRRSLNPAGIEPCIAIANNCLLISYHPRIMEKVLGPVEEKDRLAESLEFKLMASKIKRIVGSGKIGLLMFSRPEETMKFYWDFATQEQNRERMKKAGEKNKFFGELDDALTQHPLPPFSAVEKYFAPTGGVLTNEETGFHFIMFTLKRKTD